MSEKISRAELDQIAGMPSLYRCGWMDARDGGWQFDVAAFPTLQDLYMYRSGWEDYAAYNWRQDVKTIWQKGNGDNV